MFVVGLLEAAHAAANADAATQLLLDRFPYELTSAEGFSNALQDLAHTVAGVGAVGMLMLPTAAILSRRWWGTRLLLWSLWVLMLIGQAVLMISSPNGLLLLSGTSAGTPEAAIEPLLKLPGIDWLLFTPPIILFYVLYRMNRLIVADETETFFAARTDVPDDPTWTEGVQAVKARQAEREASTRRAA